MPRKRYTRLRPDRSFHMSKDIIDRLMLDNMADQVFVCATERQGLTRGGRRSVGAGQHRAARSSYRAALGRGPARGDLPEANGKVTPRDGDQASVDST